MGKWFLCVDLKSFYASVECVARGRDPLTTLLVVADESRTDKTICLAVSPALKAYGVGGRPRLFELRERIRQENALRRSRAGEAIGSSDDAAALAADERLRIDFLVAPPQMGRYMEISSIIYNVYLCYVAAEDIHPYSVDEVFIDMSAYLKTYRTTPEAFARMLVRAVLDETGITATAGIGTNLYLAKVAMDIVAKKMPPDENGCRVAALDEMSYRRTLWAHEPITDFWRVGSGTAACLARYGMKTMGDVALCSVGKSHERRNEALLYRLFGVNAQLLIDHAWGWEPCTMAQIKAYRPTSSSLSSSQVLSCPYTVRSARIIAAEMFEAMALQLVQRRVGTKRIVLHIGYERCEDGASGSVTDRYGRSVPKPATGSVTLEQPSSSTKLLRERGLALYDRIADANLLVRRLTVATGELVADDASREEAVQLDFFTNMEAAEREKARAERERERERRQQEVILQIKAKFGKNAILKGTDLQKEATARARNEQISGHKK